MGGIVDLSRTEAPGTVTTEVCVVGSGCGGATAAQLLAEGGREVVVLEEGGDYTGRALTQREVPMYDQLYMDRGGRATDDMAVSILQGRVLGGGGVINASDVVPIPEGVARFWEKRFGLADFAPEKLARAERETLAELSASRIREEQVNEANRRLRAGTEALGLRGDVMTHNRVGCAGLGTCFLGCPLGAKRNPRTVAIPKAIAAGARFFVRARAVRIERAGSEVKRIGVRILDEKGYREKGELEVRARVVILAGNAIASAQLLLRSGVGNQFVGRHLILQPQLALTAVFPERIDGFRGIPQSYAVTEYEDEHDETHGLWGFRIEGVMATPGLASQMLPFAGVDGKEQMTLYPRIAAALLLAPDEPSGVIRLSPAGRPIVRYRHRENHKERLRRAVEAAARIYLAAGAESVIVPVVPPLRIRREADLGQVGSLGFEPATASLVSAHQQGTVRLAPSPEQGGADPTGRVYGTRDVYVFDSSGFPSSASSHTMTPIMTVSRYLTGRLLSGLR